MEENSIEEDIKILEEFIDKAKLYNPKTGKDIKPVQFGEGQRYVYSNVCYAIDHILSQNKKLKNLISYKNEYTKKLKELQHQINNLNNKIEELEIINPIYKNLRQQFNRMTEIILGEDYYNMGCDTYTCDKLTCEDIINKKVKILFTDNKNKISKQKIKDMIYCLSIIDKSSYTTREVIKMLERLSDTSLI